MPSISGLSFSIGNMHLVQAFPVLSSRKSLFSWYQSRQHSVPTSHTMNDFLSPTDNRSGLSQTARRKGKYLCGVDSCQVQMKGTCYLYSCPSQAMGLQTRRKLPPKWAPETPTCCCCWCSDLQWHAWVRKQYLERQIYLWNPNALLYLRLKSKTQLF